MDTRAYTDKLTSLYRALRKQADAARKAAAHQLSQEYEKALGVLQFYKEDTTFRAATANINSAQFAALNGYLDNLSKMQNSYAKVEKGLGLNWTGAGQAATQAVISAGGEKTWAKVAGPIASIIFALIT